MTGNQLWHNADGLNVKTHGSYDSDVRNFFNRVRTVKTFGPIKTYVMDIDLELVGASTTWFPADLNNNGTNDGFTDEEMFIPQGSAVLSVRGIGKEVAVGGTSFSVGTYTKAGVAIDDDGLVTATNGAIANLGTVGEFIIGTGALVASATGTVGLTADSYLAVLTSGTFTAGKLTLIIDYVPPVQW